MTKPPTLINQINTSVKHYLVDKSTTSLTDALTLIRKYITQRVNLWLKKNTTKIKREDLIEECWVKVCTVLTKSYKPDDRPFSYLMSKVVYNHLLDKAKSDTARIKMMKRLKKGVSNYKTRKGRKVGENKDKVNLFDSNMQDSPIRHISVEDYLKNK